MIRNPDFVDECYKNSDLNPLKKLTLVIPTYNRTFYLSRCLWYHAHFPFGQIIVADSSPEDVKIINRNTAQKIRETFERDILYLEYKPETETYGGDIYRKWWDAVAHSNTEFSQFCTDKEFVIPTVSCMGIQYLNKNPKYICAFGSRVEFIKAIIRKKYVAPSCTQSYDEEKAIDRMSKLVVCHSIPENMFQLYRTDVKKILNQIISDSNINDIRYGEITTELQPLVYGKVKQFNLPGRVRDLLASRSGALQKINRAESSCLRYPSLVDYPISKKEQLHNQFIQCLTKTKPQTDTSDLNEINEITKKIIDYWMGERFDKFSLRCKAFITKQLPDPIRKFLAFTEKKKFTNSSNRKEVKKELKIIKKIILNPKLYHQYE